ncbi:hypothetical protein AB0L65_49525 [Nonomuraea sp. NPDC052116]|uniref:hypothetical protein n=1 Tax=Nonomuraea sp. NPDC052116 TaxID=3155665 RepID=UPI003412EDDE
MTQQQQRKSGTPGPMSRWIQWQRITAAQPRYAKYQAKSDREYPVIRLTPR